jgi:MraZ protein
MVIYDLRGPGALQFMNVPINHFLRFRLRARINIMFIIQWEAACHWETRLFLGTHVSSLDAGDRLATPAAFISELAAGLYLTQGFDRNILAFTPDAFQSIQKTVRSLNVLDPVARLLTRLILGAARATHLDGEGRLELPEDLKRFADLQERVLLIGQGDYFEIWSPARWETQQSQINEAGSNPGRFAALTVSIQ